MCVLSGRVWATTELSWANIVAAGLGPALRDVAVTSRRCCRPSSPAVQRYACVVCVQCAMGASSAAAAVGGAAGLRAWLAAKRFVWMTPGRMRVTTIVLLALGVIGASVGVGGA
jgi:hypothetical protein